MKMPIAHVLIESDGFYVRAVDLIICDDLHRVW